MKTKSFFTLLIATALCFYGCTETEDVYITHGDGTDTSSEETEQSGSDSDNGDGSDDSSSADLGHGAGTKESPYMASQAFEMVKNGAFDSDEWCYVKGIISLVSGSGSANREGQSYRYFNYYISDDGLIQNQETLYIERCTGLDGRKFTSSDELNRGDYVIVHGRLSMADSGIPEMYRGRLYYWNGEFGNIDFVELGDGTRENPYTVPQTIELVNNGTFDSEKGYYVKGIVYLNYFAVSDNGAGWNIDYSISDDGDYIQDNYLYVKHGFALGGEYFFDSYNDLTAEDNVIVYGRLVNDDGTPEMLNGKLYYLNGEFGELDDDEYFMERGDGSKENPYSVSQTVEMIGNGTYNPDKSYYVKGIVSIRIETSTGNIIYYISEEGDFYPETNLFVPSVYGLDGEVLSSEDALSPLDQVVVYGKLIMDSGQPGMFDVKLYYLNGETADVEWE